MPCFGTTDRTYNNAIIGDGMGNNARTKRSIYRYKNFTLQQLLNWNQTYADRHAFEVLLGHECYYYKYNYLYGYKANETLAGHVDMITPMKGPEYPQSPGPCSFSSGFRTPLPRVGAAWWAH